MSNLEWLNQQIEETKKSYDAFVLDYELFHRIGDKRDADKLKEILKHFQQIKCELEAWEVIKKYTDTSDDIVNTEFYLHKDFKSDIEDFKILKKALEVEDE